MMYASERQARQLDQQRQQVKLPSYELEQG